MRFRMPDPRPDDLAGYVSRQILRNLVSDYELLPSATDTPNRAWRRYCMEPWLLANMRWDAAQLGTDGAAIHVTAPNPHLDRLAEFQNDVAKFVTTCDRLVPPDKREDVKTPMRWIRGYVARAPPTWRDPMLKFLRKYPVNLNNMLGIAHDTRLEARITVEKLRDIATTTPALLRSRRALEAVLHTAPTPCLIIPPEPLPVPLTEDVDRTSYTIPFPAALRMLYGGIFTISPETLEFCSVAIGTASGVRYNAVSNHITVPDDEITRIVGDLNEFADAIERAR